MTYRAVHEVATIDVIGAQQLRAESVLVGRSPVEIEYLVRGTQVPSGVSVAVEAPAHGEWRHAPRQRHLIDRSVTTGAADTLADVNAVVEVSEVRQPVDPLPLQRNPGSVGSHQRCQRRLLREQLRVACHAR